MKAWPELGMREAGPEPHYDGDRRDYELRWYLWRAICRDGRPTRDEQDAAFRVLTEQLGRPGVGLWG